MNTCFESNMPSITCPLKANSSSVLLSRNSCPISSIDILRSASVRSPGPSILKISNSCLPMTGLPKLADILSLQNSMRPSESRHITRGKSLRQRSRLMLDLLSVGLFTYKSESGRFPIRKIDRMLFSYSYRFVVECSRSGHQPANKGRKANTCALIDQINLV